MSETSEQATRRRWVTLAEVVAVAGVVIAALTLWSNWSDRRADEAAKVVERTAERSERSRIDLTGTVEDGGRRLALKDEKHDLQDLVVAFPRALGIGAQQPVSDVAILTDWFEAPLLKLTDGGADEREGRLPVLVTVRYWDGDAQLSSTGVYHLIWRTEGRLLRGRTVKLEGLRLRQRGGGQAQVDALWAKEKP